MDPDEVVFTVEVVVADGTVTVAPRGELDMATQGQLRAALDEHTTARDITLDLSGLRFLDTSGLRLILQTAEASRRDGFAFSVLPGNATVQRLFDVAGVAELVPFRDGRDRGAP